jgi:hypothetical protein
MNKTSFNKTKANPFFSCRVLQNAKGQWRATTIAFFSNGLLEK